jgi:hypothetical protein
MALEHSLRMSLIASWIVAFVAGLAGAGGRWLAGAGWRWLALAGAGGLARLSGLHKHMTMCLYEEGVGEDKGV